MNGSSVLNALSWNWAFWSALVVYALACAGAGLLIIRLLGEGRATETQDSPVAFLAVSFLLGLGVLGQLWVLLALGGLLIRPVLYPLIALMVMAAAVLGRRHGRRLLSAVCVTRLALREEPLGLRVLLLATFLWMAFTFTALGRPVSGDSLFQHMMLPKATAASGMLERSWFNPGNEYFGVLGEMTYAVLFLLGNDDAAQMSTWMVAFAMAGVLLGIGVRAGLGLRGQIIGFTAFASTTAVLNWIGEGKIELIASALSLAALYLLTPRVELASLPRADLMIAGLLAGCGITTKLILGFCIAVAGGLLLFLTYAPAAMRSWRLLRTLRLQSLMPLVSASLLFGAFVVIGLAPQLIKNGVMINAPLAPFDTGGTGWLMEQHWYDASTVAHIRLIYPFVLTFGEYFSQYGQLSVLVLAFLPLVVLLPRPPSFWNSPLTAITVAAWVTIAGWAAFQGDKVVTRYIIPVMLMCIPLAAAAAEQVTARGFRPRILGIAVIAASFMTLYIVARFTTGFYFFPRQAVHVVLASAQPCERGLQWCAPMQMVNRVAPEGARVLSFSNFKYYLRADLIQCSWGHQDRFPGSTAEERWRWFYAEGYSFILPDGALNSEYLMEDLAQPPSWIKITRYQPELPDGAIGISYDLANVGPSSKPKVTCRRVRRGAWRVVQTSQ